MGYLSIIGMCVFNIGLTYGLGAIGGQAGSTLPAAFMEVSISEVSQFIMKFWVLQCYSICLVVGFWCHIS